MPNKFKNWNTCPDCGKTLQHDLCGPLHSYGCPNCSDVDYPMTMLGPTKEIAKNNFWLLICDRYDVNPDELR